MMKHALPWAVLTLAMLVVIGCSSNPAPSGKLPNVTQVNFESVVRDSKQPVLVDCWAPWCGPCRILAPTIDEIAEEFEGKIKVVKLNVDDSPQLSREFGLRNIPTVLLFKDGKVVSRRVGLQPKGNYVVDIKAALAP